MILYIVSDNNNNLLIENPGINEGTADGRMPQEWQRRTTPLPLEKVEVDTV